MCFFAYIIYLIKLRLNNNIKTKDFINVNKPKQKTKKNCTNNVVYCFDKLNCNNSCSGGDYQCINGVCKTDTVLISDVENNCNANMGILGFLVGNTAFGVYDFKCKSVDDGIAIDNEVNVMCRGGDIDIDYLKAYPSINDCNCDHPIIIPATSVKRRHVECNSKYFDLVEY